MTVIAYLAYLALAGLLTVWVAGILSRNGRVMLAEVFPDEDLARAVNQLLVMSFYLVGLGSVLLLMRGGAAPVTVPDVLALLSAKIGVVALLLGALHLIDVAALGAIRRRSHRRERAARPVPPPVAYYPPFPAPHGYAGPVPR